MPGLPQQPAIRLPIGRLAAGLVAVAAGATAAAAALAWALPGIAVEAGALPGLAVLGATALGVAFLSLFRPRPAFGWASLILAGSVIRIGLSLVLAVVVFQAVRPDRLTYWAAFFVASAAVMAAEVLLVTPALRSGPGDPAAEPTELARA